QHEKPDDDDGSFDDRRSLLRCSLQFDSSHTCYPLSGQGEMRGLDQPLPGCPELEAACQPAKNVGHGTGNACSGSEHCDCNQHKHYGVFNRRYSLLILELIRSHDFIPFHVGSLRSWKNEGAGSAPYTGENHYRLVASLENTPVTEPAIPVPVARTA